MSSPSRRSADWLLQLESSGPVAQCSGGGGGTVCFEHRVGHTRKWSVHQLRPRRARVPEVQSRVDPRALVSVSAESAVGRGGGSRLPSGCVSVVLDPAGLWEARALRGWRGWWRGAAVQREPTALHSLSGDSVSLGHWLSFHSSVGELGVVLVRWLPWSW